MAKGIGNHGVVRFGAVVYNLDEGHGLPRHPYSDLPGESRYCRPISEVADYVASYGREVVRW